MPSDRQRLERVAHDLYGPGAGVEHLGSGGFASTFKIARAGEDFAVKILDPEVADFSRFDKELAALQRVESPYVVKFRGHGRHLFEGTEFGYIEMGLVDGFSIAQLIDGGQVFNVREAASIARKIVSGATAIWDAGTAHRDLSPKNVLVDAGQNAVIVDLGLAKHIDDETMTTLPTPGTPGWMSPEQVDMASPSHGDWRSDQYVIGLLIYFLITGQRPFQVPGVMARWAAPARYAVPDFGPDFPGVTPALAAVVKKMTARQPGRRYARPAVLALELDRAIATLTEEASSETRAPAFFPVVKYYNGYAKTDSFLQSLGARAVVVGGQAQKPLVALAACAREVNTAVVIDPDTHLARSPKAFKPDGYKKLTYGNHDLNAPFKDDESRRQWCSDIWDQHRNHAPDVVIAPYFYAGPSETKWLRETLACGQTFAEIVGAEPFAVSTWRSLAISEAWLKSDDDRDVLINELTAQEFSTLYLLVATSQEAFAPLGDIETIRGFKDVFAVMAEAGVEVIVGQRGSSGLLLLALGAAAWTGGVSANLLNASAHPESKDIRRQGRPRIYVPQLLNFVPAPTYELMRDRAADLVALATPEGTQLLAEIDDFSKLSSVQATLLRRHNIRAMKLHADELAASSHPVAELKRWVDDASATYRALQGGKSPSFLNVWNQALMG